MAGLVPRLSGCIFLDWAHGVDCNWFRGFRDVQKLIAWSAFGKIVDAQEIADRHKRRCDIELFFRLVKQTLRIQIAVALIAYLPLSTLRKIRDVETSHIQTVRWVRGHLMHRQLSPSFEHA